MGQDKQDGRLGHTRAAACPNLRNRAFRVDRGVCFDGHSAQGLDDKSINDGADDGGHGRLPAPDGLSDDGEGRLAADSDGLLVRRDGDLARVMETSDMSADGDGQLAQRRFRGEVEDAHDVDVGDDGPFGQHKFGGVLGGNDSQVAAGHEGPLSLQGLKRRQGDNDGQIAADREGLLMLQDLDQCENSTQEGRRPRRATRKPARYRE